ncbi:MAG: class I SAM-dependent methyltransferase [Anaerolineae bacterium]|nr:class I SAM-dependent methyltransferase [Anaerolineae bacterium]MDW8173481.1 class I SAM-dependent methyltransferase [Anaerolineae bacterium]
MSAYYALIAHYYDLDTANKTDDLALYERLASGGGGPVFEVGCGTGRVLLHLAQQEIACLGVDTSPPMLERLERKLKAMPHLREWVRYARADAITYQTDERFGLALLSFNMLMHFPQQEQQLALLRNLRALLRPSGLLLIDLPNPSAAYSASDDEHITLERTFLNPDTNNLVMLQSVSVLNRAEQIMRIQWMYDEVAADGTIKRLIAPHVLRYFFASEIRLLLRVAGYDVQAIYGGYEEEDYDDASERMVVYARPMA